jgi:small subunit ribosomal protein S4
MTHGHFLLNGRRVDIPSIRIAPGDELTIRPHSKSSEYFKNLDTVSPAGESTVSWVSEDRKKISVKVVALPPREEAEPEINEQLIVEYYSR